MINTLSIPHNPGSRAIAAPIALGYADIECFAAQVAPTTPVYLMCLTEPRRPNGQGIAAVDFVVCCMALDDDRAIHYCRIKGGQAFTLAGRAFGEDYAIERQQALSLYDLLHTWLLCCGYQVIPATIALPQDYRYLDGYAEFVRLNRETHRFELVDVAAEALAGEGGAA